MWKTCGSRWKTLFVSPCLGRKRAVFAGFLSVSGRLFPFLLGFSVGSSAKFPGLRGKSCRSSPRLLLIFACFAAGFCKSFFAVFQFLPDAGPASPDKTTVFWVHPAPAGHNKNKSKSKYKVKVKSKGKSKEKKKRKPFSLKRERSKRPVFAHVHPCGKDSRVRPGGT